MHPQKNIETHPIFSIPSSSLCFHPLAQRLLTISKILCNKKTLHAKPDEHRLPPLSYRQRRSPSPEFGISSFSSRGTTAARPWCVAARRPLNQPWRSADGLSVRACCCCCCFCRLLLPNFFFLAAGYNAERRRLPDPTRHRREPTSRCAPGALAGKRLSVSAEKKRKSWRRKSREERRKSREDWILERGCFCVSEKNAQPQTRIVSRSFQPEARLRLVCNQ